MISIENPEISPPWVWKLTIWKKKHLILECKRQICIKMGAGYTKNAKKKKLDFTLFFKTWVAMQYSKAEHQFFFQRKQDMTIWPCSAWKAPTYVHINNGPIRDCQMYLKVIQKVSPTLENLILPELENLTRKELSPKTVLGLHPPFN